MINLNNYILEKLHIDKNTKVIDTDFPSKGVLVKFNIGKTFQEMYDYFKRYTDIDISTEHFFKTPDTLTHIIRLKSEKDLLEFVFVLNFLHWTKPGSKENIINTIKNYIFGSIGVEKYIDKNYTNEYLLNAYSEFLKKNM